MAQPVNAKYVITLAVVSGLILTLGSLFRPASGAREQPQPSDTDLSRLTRLTERRSLQTTVDYFRRLADEVAASVVHVPDTGTSGIVWTPGTIAAARLARRLPATPLATTSDGEVRASQVLWNPQLPVAGIRVAPPTTLAAAHRPLVPAEPGDWVIAVWRTDHGRMFAPAHLVEVVPASCRAVPSKEVLTTLTLGRAMAGGGLFDVDGHLLGVILPCGDTFAAVTPDGVDEMLREVESVESQLIARYGLVAGPMADDESAYFKVPAGLLVREVWTGDAADSSGLRPGDIIVAIDGEAVTGPGGLQSLVEGPEGRSFTLSVRRGPSQLSVGLGGGDAPEPVQRRSPTAGLLWESTAPGYRIEDVAENSRAFTAGIRSGDRLLRIGSVEPRNVGQIKRLLDGERAPAVFVEIERGERRWGTLLRRAEPR